MSIITSNQLGLKGLRFGEQNDRYEAQQRLNTFSSTSPLSDYITANSVHGFNLDLNDWNNLDRARFGKHSPNRYSHLTNYFEDYLNLSDEDKEFVEQRGRELYGNAWDNATEENKLDIYRNNRYIALFGEEDFNSKTKEERDKHYKDNILPYVMASIFGASSDKAAIIANMTSEGQLDVLKAYKNGDLVLKPEELAERAEKEKKYAEDAKTKKSTFRSFVREATLQSTPAGALFGTDFLEDPIDQLEDLANQTIQNVYENSEATFQNILRKDAKRKLEIPEVKTRSEELRENYQSVFESLVRNNRGDIKGVFEALSDFEKQLDDFLEKDSNYFRAFKDSKVLEDFNISDKIKIVSDIQALSEIFSESDGNVYAEAEMQAQVFERQTGGDWAANTLKQIGLGGIANIANKINGVANVGYALADEMDSAINGESNILENHLRGLNTDGTDMKGSFFNPQYWSKVEQYNTFDYNEILKADANGGISPYTNVYSPNVGDTWNWYQVLNESAAMTKFLWSDMLMMYVGGLALKGVGAATGARFMNTASKGVSWLNSEAMLNAEASSAFGRGLYEIGTKFALPAFSATGIAEAYGMQTFNQTYETLKSNIDSLKQQELINTVQQYMSSPGVQSKINDLVNQERERIEKSDVAVKFFNEDVYRKQIEDGIREAYVNSISNEIDSKYAEDYEQAAHSAANSYMLDATIEQLRMGAVNALFKSYLFDKGTRMSLMGNKNPYLKSLVSDATGKLGLNYENAIRAFKVLGNVGSGFTSNYFDDVWVSGAKGLGLNQGNNYLINKYGAQQYALATGDYIAAFAPTTTSLDAMMNGVRQGMTDKQSLYDAFVGMAGVVVGGMPSLGFIKNGVSLTHNRNGEKISLAEGLNKYWNIGILSTLAEQNQLLREAQTEIDKANKILVEKWGPQIDLLPEVLNTLRKHNTAVAGGDELEIKNTKAQEAFTIAQMLMTDNELLSQSTKVTNAVALLENIASDNLSEEEKIKLISDFRAQPQNKNTNELSDEQVFERIQKNVQTILDMQQAIRDAEELVAKTGLSKKLKVENVSNVIAQLAYEKALLGNWTKRLSEIEGAIANSETSEPSKTDSYYSQEVIGTEKTHQHEKEAIQKLISDLTKEHEENEDIIRRLVEERDKRKNKALQDSDQKHINAYILQREQLEYRIDEAKRNLETIESNIEQFSERVLSVEEILQLDPRSRARMLNPQNLKLYSKEQQTIIKDAIKQLRNKDASLLKAIQDAAILSENISNTERAFEVGVTHPEEMLAYVYGIQHDRVKELQKLYRIKEIREGIEELEKALKEKNNLTFKQHRSLILEEFVKEHPEQESFVRPYIERAKTIEQLFDIADRLILNRYSDMEISENTYDEINKLSKNLKGNIFSIAYAFNTSRDVLDALERAVDDLSLPEEVRNQIDEVLHQAEQIGMQRNATIVKSREERIKAEQDNAAKRAKEKELKTKAETKSEEVKDEPKQDEIKSDVKDESEEEITEPKTDGKVVVTENDEEIVVSKTDEELYDDVKTTDVNTTTGSNAPVLGDETALENSSVLLGNAWRTYEVGNTVQKRVGKQPGDKLNRFITWLDNAGIKLQEIIDNEVADIKNLNQDVHFLMVNPVKNSVGDDALSDVVFLVVEATDAVKGIHNKDRGGIVNANGKEYLIIGTTGYSPKNTEQQKAFNDIKNVSIQHKDSYFANNKTERFTVVPNLTTRINEIIPGRIVNALEGEEHSQPRPLSQLMFNEDGSVNEQRNPRQLGWEDLRFGVLMNTKFSIIGEIQGKHFAPKGAVGNTYVLVQDSNGAWIPLEIRPTFSSEIKRGKLKDTITDLLRKMTSPSIEIRKEAAMQLSTYLYMDKNNHIKYGSENNHVLTIFSNGQPLKTFVLNDTFNPNDFINEVFAANFRINLTPKNLQSISYIKALDEAGALNTESAILGTHNAHYTILPVGKDGKPIVPQQVKTESSSETIQGVGTNFRESSHLVNGETIREKNGEYYDIRGKKITDQSTISDLHTLEKTNDMEPATTVNTYDIYVINGDKNNPEIVGVNKNNKVIRYSKEEALKLLEKIEYEERLSSLEEKVKTELKVEQKTESEQVTTPKAEEKSEEKTKGTKEIVLGVGKKSLKDLQNSKKFTTFVDIITKDKANRPKIIQTLTDKYGKDLLKQYNTPTKLNEFLESKGITTTSIADINTWCELVKNCK